MPSTPSARTLTAPPPSGAAGARRQRPRRERRRRERRRGIAGAAAGSVLALRQLTVHAPTAIYPHVGTALDLLWKPLTYHTSQVRFAATDALYALLVLVAPRASRFLQSIHISLFAGAVTAVEREAHDRASAHGGLLALTCLVRVATPEFILREDNLPQDRGGSGGGGTSGASALFGGSPSASSKQPRQHRLPPNSCFTFAWTAGSQHLMQRRNPELTRTALRLVVDLVRIAPAVFVAHCLPDCIRMLSDMLRDQRCKLRAEAFVTHAAIVHSLGAAYLRPHVAVLLASLREALIRGVRSRLYCEEALLSLTAIALAFGEEVTLQLQPLLRPTLNLPLSPAKLEALHALATSIPSLEEAVREKVLDILTSVLTRGTTWSEIVAGEFGESHDGSDAEPLSDEEAFLAAGPGGALIGMPTTSTSPGASPGGSPVQSPNASPAMLRRERDSSEAPGASPFWSRSARAIVPPAADADGSEQAERRGRRARAALPCAEHQHARSQRDAVRGEARRHAARRGLARHTAPTAILVWAAGRRRVVLAAPPPKPLPERRARGGALAGPWREAALAPWQRTCPSGRAARRHHADAATLPGHRPIRGNTHVAHAFDCSSSPTLAVAVADVLTGA